MLLVIPALSLHKGKCHFLVSGEAGTEPMYLKYSNQPEILCQLWRRENAKTVNLNDYDAFFEGDNTNNLSKFLEIASILDIPVQVLSEFTTIDNCYKLLRNGVHRLILFEFALNYPEQVKLLIKEFTPQRIAFFVNTYKGQVQFLRSSQTMMDVDYISYLKELGAVRIIFRDDERFDTTEGPNISVIDRICDAARIKVTIYGTVTNPEQLWELQKHEHLGIDSVIIDKPLYKNAFPCQKIWRSIEAELEEDIRNQQN